MPNIMDEDSQESGLLDLFGDFRNLRDQLREIGVSQSISLISYAFRAYGYRYSGSLSQRLAEVIRYSNRIDSENEIRFQELVRALANKFAEFDLYLDVSGEREVNWPSDLTN